MVKVSIVRYVDPHDLNTYPMLGLGYIKSYVEHYMPGGVEFDYLENQAGLDSVAAWDSDIYAFTALSQDYQETIEMARFVRARTDAPVILGGSHISFLPRSLDPVFDCGVLGDGEPTFLTLCQLLDQGRRIEPGELKDIPGTIFWEDESLPPGGMTVIGAGASPVKGKRLVMTRPSKGIEHLDELPIPDRKFGGIGLLPHLLSSRGCPFTCSFCTSSEYSKKFRAFSAEYLKAEIVSVATAYPDCEFLPFWDDLFIANRKRFAAVVEMLEQTKLNQIFAFSCGVRVDLVDRELCELLLRGNFRAVFFGLESGADRVLRWLKGGKVTVERMQQALNLFKEYGITVAAPFIVGIPTEEECDLLETYDFVLRNMEEGKLHEAQSHVMCPMPGTMIWRNALAAGQVSEAAAFGWGRMRYYSGWRNYLAEAGDRGTFEQWVTARDRNDSLYINGSYSQQRLYDIMLQREEKIDSMGISFKKY